MELEKEGATAKGRGSGAHDQPDPEARTRGGTASEQPASDVGAGVAVSRAAPRLLRRSGKADVSYEVAQTLRATSLSYRYRECDAYLAQSHRENPLGCFGPIPHYTYLIY